MTSPSRWFAGAPRGVVGRGARDHRVDVVLGRASRVQERVDQRVGAFTLGHADAVRPHAELERLLERVVAAQHVGVAFERLPVVRELPVVLLRAILIVLEVVEAAAAGTTAAGPPG